MNLPNRIFFTGVPGSRWSGIAQTLEKVPGMNTSDRTPERTYSHSDFSGHLGAYFGAGMELAPDLSEHNIDSAHTNLEGCRLIKSHDWAYKLPEIRQKYTRDWIMLVYRPDLPSITWWYQAGGFEIKYPRYDSYVDHIGMQKAIAEQNDQILKFACRHGATWSYFTNEWIYSNFGADVEPSKVHTDILVTIIK